MVPIKAVRLTLGDLLAADVPSLAPVAANKVALIIADFTPAETLAFVDLTLATFTGSTPKAGVAGTQQVGIDPTTQEQVITNLAPVGGWRWECTAAPSPAQTIFGFALVDNAVAVLVATQKLLAPIVITNVGDFIDLAPIEFRLSPQPLV